MQHDKDYTDALTSRALAQLDTAADDATLAALAQQPAARKALEELLDILPAAQRAELEARIERGAQWS